MRRIIFMLLFVGLGFFLPVHAVCRDGDAPLDIVTPYHFHSSVLTVRSDIPLGTVIATTMVPEGTIAPCRGDMMAVFWQYAPLRAHFVMLPTTVPGVGVRVVSEKRAWSDTVGRSLWRRGKEAALLHLITQGGMRIELVKIGPILSGELDVSRDPMQYRTYTRRKGGTTLVAREHFQHVGPLFIQVMA